MSTSNPPKAPKTHNQGSPSFDYNKRLDELTSKISEIVRSSSLGLIAVAWLGLSATKDSSGVVSSLDERWLMTGAAFALIALFLDFSQYVFGYFAVLGDKKSQLRRSHRNSVARYIRFICFYGKMFVAALSSLVIIVAVSSAVLKLKLWF
jgi:hypothetical protein